jgi:hypothetical protein
MAPRALNRATDSGRLRSSIFKAARENFDLDQAGMGKALVF